MRIAIGPTARSSRSPAERRLGAQIMLYPVDQHAERRIDDAELRIKAHRGGEKHRSVGRIAVEEIAVVEIAVGACECDRLGALVQREIVALGQHRSSSSRFFLQPNGMGMGVNGGINAASMHRRIDRGNGVDGRHRLAGFARRQRVGRDVGDLHVGGRHGFDIADPDFDFAILDPAVR